MSKREVKCFDFDRNHISQIPESHSLELYHIPETSYSCAIRRDDWKDYQGKVVFCEPDTLVPTDNSLFSFLTPDAKFNVDSQHDTAGTYARVRAKKFLKGLVYSYGVLVPISNELAQSENLYKTLKLGHYEPQISQKGSGPDGGVFILGETESPPNLQIPVYDIEGGLKYAHKVFDSNDLVEISVKYHGSNFRAVFHNGQIYVGSHYNWKKEYPTKPIIDGNRIVQKYGEELGRQKLIELEEKLDRWKPQRSIFWEAFKQNPEIEQFCKNNPDIVVYGEIVNVQGKGFSYGCGPGQYKIYVFDLLRDGKFIPINEARELGKDLNWVHVLKSNHPFNLPEIIELVQNLPVIHNVGSYEEGICVKHISERWNDCIGRSIVKFISPKYLEKS